MSPAKRLRAAAQRVRQTAAVLLEHAALTVDVQVRAEIADALAVADLILGGAR